jgi:hypothetical protein
MSNGHRLPPELVALVHHVELDKAGWWEKALQGLALTAFQVGEKGAALSETDVCKTLNDDFKIEIPAPAITEAMGLLAAQGDLVEVGNGRFKISNAALLRCQAEIAAAIDLGDEVRDRFQKELALSCPTIDVEKAWKAFIEDFLVPTVRELGASTYEILSEPRRPGNLPQIDVFTRQFPAELSVDLTNFLHAFLNPSDPAVRRFVLRTLNALFVVKAGGLDKRTIERLSESAKAFSATLFFDSNVLFSLLGLHENPADHSSRTLLHLVRKLSASVPIKLRVLPPTLDEMKRVMKASQEALLELKISPALLGPAINAGVSGVTAKYLALTAERKRNVAPTDYFEPYLKNLLTILRGHGVELFNEDLTKYGLEQNVIDDILERQTFEIQRYGPNAKTYEQLRHDMVLWHFVIDKRPIRPESPIDAEYWIVTADFRFLGFDAYKHRRITSDVPICMHPLALVQLLRFWVPLDYDFETALFDAIRLPTVIAPLDTDAERISLQILNALSTFENIGDLPPETTTRILLNDALRQRLAIEKDVSKQIELVREALIEENRLSETKLQSERARSAALHVQTKSLESQVADQSRQIESLRSQLQEQSSKAVTEASLAEQRRVEVNMLQRAARARTRRQLFCGAAGSTLWIIPFIWYVLDHYRANHILLGSVCGGIAMLWYVSFKLAGTNMEHISDWRPFVQFSRSSGAVISALLLAVAGNAAWDLLKKWFTH